MFDDFEEFEKNHIPDEYEREELYKMAKEKFDDVYKDSREIQDEYKRIKSSPKLTILWSILTGWRFKDEEINIDGLSPMDKITAMLLKLRPEKLVLDNEWKSNIMKTLEIKPDKDSFNATAACTILIAEQDLVTDKDFQNRILLYKKKFEESIAENGMTSYQCYIIQLLLLKKWVDETYYNTLWKDYVDKEIEKIEREPLPGQK